ncbi:hypothetical protein, partial [Tenacibaculum sp. SG-28]|uniref:hypothetical protein n=1 Tax=Tenacibaculum sp. SG-28 TaxID=754426 RepID=UPI000D440D64
MNRKKSKNVRENKSKFFAPIAILYPRSFVKIQKYVIRPLLLCILVLGFIDTYGHNDIPNPITNTSGINPEPSGVLNCAPPMPTNNNGGQIVLEYIGNSQQNGYMVNTINFNQTNNGVVDVLRIVNTAPNGGQLDAVFNINFTLYVKKLIIEAPNNPNNSSVVTVKPREGGNFPYNTIKYCELVDVDPGAANMSETQTVQFYNGTNCGNTLDTTCYTTGDTLADLNVSGSGTLVFYTSQLGGNSVSASTTLVDGNTYYVANKVGNCESARLPVTVCVEGPQNICPIAGNVANFNTSYTQSISNFDMTQAFAASDDPLTFTVTNSDNSVATLSTSGNNLSFNLIGPGTTNVSITASDGLCSDTATFSINLSNACPQASNVANLSYEYTDNIPNFNMAQAFATSDDNLTFSVSNSNNSVATVSSNGSSLTFNPIAPGTTNITITASDGFCSDTVTFSLNLGNTCPQASTVANLNYEYTDNIPNFNMSQAFNASDDNLTFSVSNSNNSVATVSSNGSSLTFNPIAPGTTNITITASDGLCSDTATFSVNLSNACPQASNVANLNYEYTDNIPNFNMAQAFNASDDNLTFSINNSNNSVATVSSNGSSLTFNPIAPGTTNITITASDGFCSDTVTFSLNLTCPNLPAPIDNNAIASNSNSASFYVNDTQVQTQFGSSGTDSTDDILYGKDGYLYITGKATSSWAGYTIVNPYVSGEDMYLAKLDPDTYAVEWVSFMGASSYQYGRKIVQDANNNIIVSGYTATNLT